MSSAARLALSNSSLRIVYGPIQQIYLTVTDSSVCRSLHGDGSGGVRSPIFGIVVHTIFQKGMGSTWKSHKRQTAVQ